MEIKTIGIVGLGQMGQGIAQVAVQSGFEVLLHDATPELTRKGGKLLEATLLRLVQKGRLKEEAMGEQLFRVHIAEKIEELKDADIVIEAIIEEEAVKGELFARLDAICPESTILASNTSSISITKIASATGRADRVIGMHFMNPVPRMELVELIRGLATSDETYAAVKELAKLVDMLLVIGSPNSSNSNRLREIGEHCGIPSYLIDCCDDIGPI